ncbi:hypothetical protein [Pseudomonas retamae]|uniref:Uncharacterized protein n=1 Tax=Pseudomonas retamae TaxID=702110 RepID=A0ABW7DBL3_9PSED
MIFPKGNKIESKVSTSASQNMKQRSITDQTKAASLETNQIHTTENHYAINVANNILFTSSFILLAVKPAPDIKIRDKGIIDKLLLEITSEPPSITATTKKGRFLQQYPPHFDR